MYRILFILTNISNDCNILNDVDNEVKFMVKGNVDSDFSS